MHVECDIIDRNLYMALGSEANSTLVDVMFLQAASGQHVLVQTLFRTSFQDHKPVQSMVTSGRRRSVAENN